MGKAMPPCTCTFTWPTFHTWVTLDSFYIYLHSVIWWYTALKLLMWIKATQKAPTF